MHAMLVSTRMHKELVKHAQVLMLTAQSAVPLPHVLNVRKPSIMKLLYVKLVLMDAQNVLQLLLAKSVQQHNVLLDPCIIGLQVCVHLVHKKAARLVQLMPPLVKHVWQDMTLLLISLVLLMLLLLVHPVLQVTGERMPQLVSFVPKVVHRVLLQTIVSLVMQVLRGHKNPLVLNVLSNAHLAAQLLVEHLNVVPSVLLLLPRYRHVQTGISIMVFLISVKKQILI